MKTIQTSELRKELKKYLTQAIHEPIFIERSGIVFRLQREGWVSSFMKDMVVRDIGHNGETVQLTGEVIEASYCKNGHRLPDGREKCLQKGCKYAR